MTRPSLALSPVPASSSTLMECSRHSTTSRSRSQVNEPTVRLLDVIHYSLGPILVPPSRHLSGARPTGCLQMTQM
ncbi:hypothetical protein BD310DRAFT_940001 [Dichomitus squalens]|uniref:Uncharacterized protein n=1 Tax=Dichomitus squalens TaxID=114155 RepID=A0A4Q9PGT7_9APHY|nr:hypothetical protein BD310DRAFT_940001 [Dichomitus squalens]